jgi:hypothetical protein
MLTRNLTRMARGAVIAVAMALVVAAPAAAATPPTRNVYQPHPFVIPAGQACAFDVAGHPTSGFEAETVFSDGRVKDSIRVKGYYENLETGARYWVNDTYTELDVSLATNTVVITTSGQVETLFWPGDAGPFGPVTTATMYRFDGTTTNTVDLTANRTAAFSWSGRIIDICAALS